MNRIVEILKEIKPECDFSNSSDFIVDELLDSFDVVALVSELEESFHILIDGLPSVRGEQGLGGVEVNAVVDGLDVLPENFCSLEAIAAMVRKNGGTVA